MNTTALLTLLQARRGRILDDTAALVNCESPSEDLEATAVCAEMVAELGNELLGVTANWYTAQGRPHLIWRCGGPTRVLLIGHCDTVWPSGTLARWPFSVEENRATGPGVFDMKAGLAQMFHGLSVLDDLTGVTVIVTTDEEIGSPTSRAVIEGLATGARAALVLEASLDGALKTVRKGASLYRLAIDGKAAHAGLEPEFGVNATVEAAHQILAIAEMGDAAAGTTVTPTIVRSGRTTNTVPDHAEIAVDVRAADRSDQFRVDRAMRALRPVVPGARLELDADVNRPPLTSEASAELFAVAASLADDMGLAPLRGVAAGGGSDGNFTAGVGVRTLDGLGAVGAHAHAEGEWASVADMPDRAALLAALVAAIRNGA
ncbi:MAG: M20 family metallopeptidase [Actinobacteria bacterium]|nr:M20 family metallopeptidase [Actinomycetota bacterium]